MPDDRTTMLDLPSGVRAVAERGVVRFERTPAIGDARVEKHEARARSAARP